MWVLSAIQVAEKIARSKGEVHGQDFKLYFLTGRSEEKHDKFLSAVRMLMLMLMFFGRAVSVLFCEAVCVNYVV